MRVDCHRGNGSKGGLRERRDLRRRPCPLERRPRLVSTWFGWRGEYTVVASTSYPVRRLQGPEEIPSVFGGIVRLTRSRPDGTPLCSGIGCSTSPSAGATSMRRIGILGQL